MSNSTMPVKLAKARQQLALTQYFWGARIIATPCVERNEIPTMATDGTVIYYNTDFVEKHSVRELVGVLVHELLHNCLLHAFRFEKVCEFYMAKYSLPKEVVHEIANCAMDFAINPIVKADGFALPDGALLCDEFRDMAWEEIMKRLMSDKKFVREIAACAGKGKKTNRVGDVIPAPGTPGEQKAAENAVKASVRVAAISAKSVGSQPGWITRLLRDWDEAQIDWATKLHRLVDVTRGPVKETSWEKPHKRYVQHGLYLPRRVPRGFGTLVCAMDVSGSVSDEEARLMLAEVAEIVNQHSPEKTYFVQFDVEIKGDPEVFEPGDEFPNEITRRGYGGTDFGEPFRWVEKNGIKPGLMIMLTDGECRFPDKPDYPVIWVITQTHITAPWGETIHLINGQH